MPTEIQGIKFYTVTEVSEALKVSPNTVRKWVKDGKLSGKRIGRPILVSEQSLQDFVRAGS